jgi:CDP-diacylglycerol--glycerol-3-phosphate 3-phosphatidyltransferase
VFEPTLPNLLTVFRILLIPVLVAVLLNEVPAGDAIAAGVFALASVTDFADGYLARRQGTVSNFGKLMDPLADKLLVTSALVSLVALDQLASWVAMVIIAREFAVTGLRQVAIEQGHVVAASIWGKLKTFVQVAMVLALIIVNGHPWPVDVLIYVTVAVTVLSGADYFFGLRALFAERPGAHPPGSRSGTPSPPAAQGPPAPRSRAR